MNLPLKIALRYLFAKKSHNVINIISAISAAGMAIGTAALVVILSVYNGFSALVSDSLGSIEADILISPKAGKVFVPNADDALWLNSLDGVESVCGILQENVFIDYDGHNGVATAMGIDSLAAATSTVREKMVDGEFSLCKGSIPQAVVGVGFAYRMGINHRFMKAATLFFPDKDKNISVSNPAASLRSVKVWPAGLFSITTDTDNSLILLQLSSMRELLGYNDGEVSILIFVVIIIAFNIFGSLTMLMIEKQEDIQTLRSLGARDAVIRRTFVLEGWMISLLGMVTGLVLGLLLVWAQQQFGFIKMPGDFSMSSYPVIIRWTDITITAISVAVIGYFIALVPARKSIPREGTSDPMREDV